MRMRTREQVLKDLNEAAEKVTKTIEADENATGAESVEALTASNLIVSTLTQSTILDILLDIRDLLQDLQKGKITT
jgi:hypothetical protein